MQIRELMVGGCVAAMIAATPAVAQTANVAGATAADPQAAGNRTDAAAVGDIIVTAQRTSQSIQKVPLAIMAVDAEQMQRKGVNDLMTLETRLGGIHLYSTGPSTQVIIRGVGTSSALAQNDPSVAVNVDGVYRARGTTFNSALYDAARIEVLKGPQGTLYGRNATVGAINIIHNLPRLGETSGSATLEAGNYHLYRAGAVINLPVSNDLAVRASMQGVSREGYLSNGYSDAKNVGGRLSALYDPGTGLSIRLSGDFYSESGAGEGTVLQNTSTTIPAGTGTLYQVISTDPWFSQDRPGSIRNRDWGVDGQIDYDLGGVVLTAIPAFRHVYSLNTSYSGGARFGIYNGFSSDTYSFEGRVASAPGRPLQWVAGLYAYRDTLGTNVRSLSRPATLAAPSIRAGTTAADYGDTSYAAFGQVTVPVIDIIRLIGGLRYTYQKRTIGGEGYTFDYNPEAGNPTPAQIAASRTGVYPVSGSLTYKRFDYRAGVEIDLSRRSMLYATYSTGFKAGGINARNEASVTTGLAIPFTPAGYLPETLKAAEIGTKNSFFNGRVRLNVSLFHWKYDGRQFLANTTISNVPPGTPATGFRTFNSGPQTIYGADVDISIAPTPRDTFDFSYYYLHGRYDNDPANPAAFIGASTPYSPKNSFATAYTHIFPLANGAEISVGGDAKHEDGQLTNASSLNPVVLQKAYTLYNASIAYTTKDDRFQLRGWVRNIGDTPVKGQTSTSTANPTSFYSSIRPPRTYGVTLTGKF